MCQCHDQWNVTRLISSVSSGCERQVLQSSCCCLDMHDSFVLDRDDLDLILSVSLPLFPHSISASLQIYCGWITLLGVLEGSWGSCFSHRNESNETPSICSVTMDNCVKNHVMGLPHWIKKEGKWNKEVMKRCHLLIRCLSTTFTTLFFLMSKDFLSSVKG